DFLAVEAKLVAPVLSIEGPELMLFVHFDTTTARLTGSGHLLLDFLTELTAQVGRDLELDRVDLVREVHELVDEAVVAASREITGAVDREGLRERDFLEDAGANAGVLELLRA